MSKKTILLASVATLLGSSAGFAAELPELQHSTKGKMRVSAGTYEATSGIKSRILDAEAIDLEANQALAGKRLTGVRRDRALAIVKEGLLEQNSALRTEIDRAAEKSYHGILEKEAKSASSIQKAAEKLKNEMLNQDNQKLQQSISIHEAQISDLRQTQNTENSKHEREKSELRSAHEALSSKLNGISDGSGDAAEGVAKLTEKLIKMEGELTDSEAFYESALKERNDLIAAVKLQLASEMQQSEGHRKNILRMHAVEDYVFDGSENAVGSGSANFLKSAHASDDEGDGEFFSTGPLRS